MQKPETIIISRTDSIGDVVLTLPVCGILKERYPSCRIIFLGRKYTQPVVNCCTHVDEFMDWDEISNVSVDESVKMMKAQNASAIVHVFPDRKIATVARRAKIPIRIGTSHRLFHWITCNKLLNIGRKNSDLHEAQLNFLLLSPLDISRVPPIEEIRNYFGFSNVKPLRSDFASFIAKDKFNLILHPKSRGSAREWGIANFSELIKILPSDKFKLFVTGTKEEGMALKDLFSENPHVVNMTGKFSLDVLISFINACDGMVAASTGPLHLAAALGKRAVGIFSPMRPIHPGRWAPLGQNSTYLVKEISCNNCRKDNNCNCIREITPEQVKQSLGAID